MNKVFPENITVSFDFQLDFLDFLVKWLVAISSAMFFCSSWHALQTYNTCYVTIVVKN